jgi:hypothetical protein
MMVQHQIGCNSVFETSKKRKEGTRMEEKHQNLGQVTFLENAE